MLLTFNYELPLGHRLMEHPGKCKYLHGHNYVIEVAVGGKLDLVTDMLMDFSDLKKTVKQYFDEWDHGFVLRVDDPAVEAIRQYSKLITIPSHPTAEMLSLIWRQGLQALFPNNSVGIRVRETRDCGAFLV